LEALKAKEILEKQYEIPADVWSATSYKELYLDALDTERNNMRHPDGEDALSYIERTLSSESGIFVAVSDYLKALPCSIAKWIPGPFITLGTDGYGRSENRESLRDFFEVDARHIAYAVLYGLFRQGAIEAETIEKAQKDLDIDPDKPNPVIS
jgi:pyruvate dehydrogenase E1 component